jgi:hypothetical protein
MPYELQLAAAGPVLHLCRQGHGEDKPAQSRIDWGSKFVIVTLDSDLSLSLSIFWKNPN